MWGWEGNVGDFRIGTFFFLETSKILNSVQYYLTFTMLTVILYLNLLWLSTILALREFVILLLTRSHSLSFQTIEENGTEDAWPG